jgi:class 3 adenylate cyclase/tetratricopeptide (TPR) repeat protein
LGLGLERRLAVILVADMVDYSRLMQADQDGTIGLIQALRDKWLEPEVEARGGEVLKRLGDGWIIAFGSVSNAIEAAVAVQEGLYGHPEIRLRLAAHLGEIADDGADIYGPGLNIAARLQTEAPPGGVMISEDLHRQLDSRLASGFSDAGSFTLKNIAVPISGFQWRPAERDRPSASDVPVIAVEPITSSPDGQEIREAAADLQEQLVHSLSRRTGIRVLALDGKGEASPTYFLRGRLRYRRGEARLTLTLLLRADNRAIWSEVYEAPSEDLFGFCDQAAEKADNDLRMEINAFDGERIAHLPDDALSSSELRTRAAHLFYATTIASFERAITLLDRALRLDHSNAMSHSMWAYARHYLAAARFEALEPETIAQIKASADQAVQAAPRADYVFKTRADVRTWLRDLEGARRDIQRMKRINPNYTLGYETEGLAELAAGAYDAAINALTQCVARSERDPFLPFRIFVLSVALVLAGRPKEAARAIGEAIELRHDCRAYWLLLAEAHARSGADAEADEARAMAARLPDRPDILAPRLPLPDGERALMSALAPLQMGHATTL